LKKIGTKYLINKDEINRNTRRSISWLKNVLRKAELVELDSCKQKRLLEQKCKVCYYVDDGISGQAFTDSICIVCGDIITNATTDTDKVCKKCSKEYNLCCHCGGNISLQLI